MSINMGLSVEIFDQLMNGRIINKYKLSNSGEPIADPLFTEIMDNLADYRKNNAMNGFELIETPTYVYLNDAGGLDGKTDISMKVYFLLLIIGKYLTVNGHSITKITSHTGGLTPDDFKEMANIPYVDQILEKSKMTGKSEDSLMGHVKNLLVDRGIMLEKPSSKSYVLSEAGKAFFEELMENKHRFMDEENDCSEI